MEATVSLDHDYSRHWSESYKTDHSHAKPIQWILPLYSKNPHARTSRLKSQLISVRAKSNSSSDGSEDEIDVESLDEVMSPYVPGRSYDVQKARLHMNETEKLVLHSLTNAKTACMRSETDWEEYFNKSSWSMTQNKIYSKVIKVLEDEKLARLAFKGVNNEPIARRLSLDRSAACLRRIFAEFEWDQKLTQWLHSLLVSRLPAAMLASYLVLIQTLRSKVPTLVERMIMQSSPESGVTAADSLNIVLKRPWEPILVKYPLLSKERFYDPPIIMLIPNSPFAPSPTMAHRKRFWNSHLSQLGKIVTVQSPEKAKDMSILQYITQLAASVHSRIGLYRTKYPGRSIVLAGWHNASILSCHISLVDKVSAVICLGFPTKTLNGPRATVDDVFCDMTTPTLFVVGEEADSCNIDKIEDFREQLLTRCETHLVAIPGADDALRVSEKVKKRACVTQQMVDRMVLDQIANFLSDTLIMNLGKWHIAESLVDLDASAAKSRARSQGRRKRQNSEEAELAAIKRRRISSATTAKISEILSGQSAMRGRDGARTPVQGVAFNLQTGSISGLATVPNVLKRSLSKPVEQAQGHKGKTGRSKIQPRSITIDLAKDTAAQIKQGKSHGTSPDPSLLATGSQTEAAVATILGKDFASSHINDQRKIASPTQEKISSTPTTLQDSSFSTASSSAFTRVSSVVTSSQLTSGSSILPAMQHSVPSTGTATQYVMSKTKSSYTNVKFQSTFIKKPPSQKPISQADSSNLSTINKQHWAGILDSVTSPTSVTKAEFPRKYPYMPPTVGDKASHISSRSRKEERETMQATAILEQLTSGIANDTTQNDQLGSTQVGATQYRRHSYDSTFLLDGHNKGRGRVRTRGGSTPSPLARNDPQRRRKTLHEERPSPPANYYQKPRPKPASLVRYVMNQDASSAISQAAAKASRTISAPIATITPRTDSKPSVLPVYTFSQPPAATGIKIQSLSSSATTSKPAAITPVSKIISGVSSSFLAAASKKPSDVVVGQRLPVKFPGAVPGSSYTFVTIPALTGPPLPAAGQKAAIRKVLPNPTKIKKYSVVPRNTVSLLASPSTTKSSVPVSVVALKNKALPKASAVKILTSAGHSPKTVTLPLRASPVVIHKVRGDTKAGDGDTQTKDSKPK